MHIENSTEVLNYRNRMASRKEQRSERSAYASLQSIANVLHRFELRTQNQIQFLPRSGICDHVPSAVAGQDEITCIVVQNFNLIHAHFSSISGLVLFCDLWQL